MTWEDEGLEPGESPEERREFRRMMGALSREGRRRMIERPGGEIQTDPHDTQSRYDRGLLFNELRVGRRAVEYFGRAIALDPANVEALSHRAMVYLGLGEPNEAVADCDEMLRRFPGNPSIKKERRLAQEQAKT